MGGRYFTKLVLKLLGGCLLAFMLVMSFIWSLLNSQHAHQVVITAVNHYMLEPQNVRLSLGQLIFNPLTMGFTINNLGLQWGNDLKHPQGGVQISQTQVQLDYLRSYLRKRLFLHGVYLSGVSANLTQDSQGNIILPSFLNKNDSTEKPPSITNPFLLFLNFPNTSEIRNVTVKIFPANTPATTNTTTTEGPRQEFFLKKFSLTKVPRLNRKTQPQARVEVSGLQTPYANLENIEGSLFLGHTLEESSYILHLTNLDIDAEPTLGVMEDFKAQGHIHMNGVAKTPSWAAIPTFHGQVQWKDLQLKQFAVYEGTADVLFQNRTLFYTNARVTPKTSPLVTAFGFYEFFDEFYFENYGVLKNFSFTELLAGLGAPGSPLEFPLSSDNAMVSGKITPLVKDNEPPRHFELWAQGQIDIGSPQIVGFSPAPGVALSPGNVNLKLYVNHFGLDFLGSHVAFRPTGKIELQEGFIDITPAAGVGATFAFTGKNIDLKSIEYFLGVPATGQANFEGLLTVAPLGPIFFEAQTSIPKNAEVGHIQFHKADFMWGINPTDFWLKDGTFVFERDRSLLHPENAQLNVDHFEYIFDSQSISLSSHLSGELSALAWDFGTFLPQNYVDFINGSIKNFDIEFQGPWRTPENSSLHVSGHMENMLVMSAQMSSLDLNVACDHGVCENSSLTITGIQGTNQTNPGWLKMDLSHLSSQDLALTVATSRVPLEAFTTLPNHTANLGGSLFGNVQVSGPFQDLTLKGQLDLGEAKVAGVDIGNVTNRFSWAPEQRDITLEGLSGSVILKYKDLNNHEDSRIDLTLNKLDLARFLPESILETQDIYTSITGNFYLQGQNFLHVLTDSETFRWDKLNGKGVLEESSLFWNSIIFKQRETPPTVVLENAHLHFSDWTVASSFGQADLLGDMTFPQKNSWNMNDFSWSWQGQFDFALEPLKDLFPTFFQEVQGRIHGRLLTNHNSKNSTQKSSLSDKHQWDGYLTWNIPKIDFVGLGKTLENIQGQASLEDSRMIINNFSIHSGDGVLTLGGEIDFFSALFSDAYDHLQLDAGYWPTVDLDLRTQNFPTRIPVPLFEVSDVVLDSAISLTGNKPPYKLEGRIDLLDVQLFRDATCEQLVSDALNRPGGATGDYSINIQNEAPLLTLDLRLYSANSIRVQSRCLRGKFSLYPFLEITGPLNAPLLSGALITDNAILQLLKGRFFIRKGEVAFTNLSTNDPTLDIDMDARIAGYTIFGNVSGRLSTAQLTMSADPPTLANGDTITQADIVAMVSSGFVPTQSSPNNFLTASTSLTGFLGIDNTFESTINQTVSQVTLGVIDSVNIAPATQNGQLSWQLTAVRSLSERLSLGISYETGDYGISRTAYVNYLLNTVVSFYGGYEYDAFALQPVTQEFSGGLRFRFGGQ